MAAPADDPNPERRGLLMGGAALGAAALATAASAAPTPDGRSDTEPRVYKGEPMPEPPPERSAGPIRPGRGSMLAGKVAVVTGSARGIGRAIAVEYAANGADVVCVDICGFVSPASNAKPATPADLEETVRQIHAYGRKGEGIRADIRDIAALRRIADDVDRRYGKIDIVVADAAIQRWKGLLEMDDADWRDVIDNNLNGTANTIRAFAPKMVARKHGPDHRAQLHAGQARHQGRLQLLRQQVGHPRADEVGGPGARRVQHHRQRGDPRPRRHRAHPLREALQRERRRDAASRPAKIPARSRPGTSARPPCR